MKTALVLEGGLSGETALNLCQALGRLGWNAAVAMPAASSRLPSLSRYCRKHAAVAVDRTGLAKADAAVLDALERLIEACGVELVLPADIAGALCAEALLARRPELKRFPFPRPDTLLKFNNKWSFYQLLVELGLPTPRTWLVERPEQGRDLPLPLVLKPLDQSAGIGVGVARTAAERDRRLGGADASLSLPALAQEFVDGADVDLSFLSHNGRLLAWTVQTRRADGTVDYIDDERVVALGRTLAEASGYTGLAHLDMRYDGAARAGVKIIECNPRPWASMPMTEGLAGVDYIERGLELAHGRARAPQSGAATGACGELRGIVKSLARGRPLTPCESVVLRGVKADPVPVIARGLLRLFG